MSEVIRLGTPADRCQTRPEPIAGLAAAVAGVEAAAITALTAIYREVQNAVDVRNPLCSASGKCCHFDAYGHRLYVTTLELSAFVRNLTTVPAGHDHGGCRFQSSQLCTVHAIRPFGCRIYYCDATAQQWQQDQYEAFHQRIKLLHEQTGTPYFYVEWRAALATVLGA